MIGILTGCARKWWEGLSAPRFNVITNNTTVAFESNLFEGVDTFIRYVVNESRRTIDDRQYRAKKKRCKRI